MKQSYNIIVTLVCLFFFSGCLKEADIEAEFEPQVFIYGYLIDNTDYIKVTVQRTVPVNVTTVDAIEDATISLYTEDVNSNITLVTDDFVYANEGDYYSNDTVTGIVGNKYWIEVVLTDGTTYESEHETLKPPVEIIDIRKEGNFSQVVFSDPPGESNFYIVDYNFYEGSNRIARRFELSNDNLFDGNGNAFIETEYIEGNGIGISLNNLNYLTYQFYVTSFDQYDNQVDFGSTETVDAFLIFSKPPVNLIGNIKNKTTNRTALGFFGVFSSDYAEAIF
ncbi:DUF4249 family protein [Pontimicrobium sp. SW4]|uniref:DUF4249 family protein n=1 Tax=Pontimicrobium sp. SW4 TaxID=3153519 RepID=A0AAU7BVB4_9FLAO